MNWLPGVSQLKSAVQFVTGDFKGAAQTQKDFFQQCPVVSQVTAGVQLITGHEEAAEKTFKKGVGTVNGIVNSIPVVGHAKALVHLACDDEQGAKEALKSSTRTIGVLGGGVGGFLVGGPVGAVAGGLSGGAAMDITYTVAEKKPNGYIATIERVIEDDHKAGALFDLAGGFAFDGLAGYSAGKTASNIMRKNQLQSAIDSAKAEAFKLEENAFDNRHQMTDAQYDAQMRAAGAKMNYAEHLEGTKTTYAKNGVRTTTTKPVVETSAIPTTNNIQNKSVKNNANNNQNNQNNNQNNSTNQISREMVFTVEYSAEELSTNRYGSRIQTLVNLLDSIKTYFMSQNGRDSRMIEGSTIIINEILPGGSRVETRMRTRDLYIRQVTVYDVNSNVVTHEVDNGVIGGYNRGTTLIPIQYYTRRSEELSRTFGLNLSPGFLIRSQAFRISESLRFRRSLRYVQLTGGRGNTELWPDFQTRHNSGTRYITPFEYASEHRSTAIDFSMFHVFYGNWEDLSDQSHQVVDIPVVKKKQ